MTQTKYNYNKEEGTMLGIRPADVCSIVSKFVDGQILLAISYVEYKYQLPEVNTENVLQKIKQDIYNGEMFTDFLPPYYWGAIDSIFVKKGIEPCGDAIAIITVVMFLLYGPERGEQITKDLLDMNEPYHPKATWFNTLRVAGSLGLDAYLAYINSLEDKNSQNNNMFGENSFSDYLHYQHEHYILEMIKRHA